MGPNKDGKNEPKRMQRPKCHSSCEEGPVGFILRYQDSALLETGTLNRVSLFLTNNTGERIEGWLTLVPPSSWKIEPGDLLMIAVRPGSTIQAEFFFSVPESLEEKEYLLCSQVRTDAGLSADAEFDLAEHLPDSM